MSENEREPVVIVERRGSGFVAFLWGAAVGAVAALLFAPRSGEETQRELREGARRFREEAEEKLTDLKGSLEDGYVRAREEVEDRVETARRTVEDRQRRAEEALKAGKDAARRARSDLEQRVAETKAAYKTALAESEASEEPAEEADPSRNGGADE